jgi:predicted nuclease of predicted toxin-antitoxin system
LPEETKRSIVLLIDENVDADLASELRKRGIDAINVQEAQLRNLTDEVLLQYAISEKGPFLHIISAIS